MQIKKAFYLFGQILGEEPLARQKTLKVNKQITTLLQPYTTEKKNLGPTHILTSKGHLGSVDFHPY